LRRDFDKEGTGAKKKMSEKIRLGILGTGRIVARVMTDMQNAESVELKAIASRTREGAEAAAARFGAPIALAGFEAMAACGDVDLVYIALPNPFHAKYACLMMEHGKHVLCEKPLAVNTQEAEQMIACAGKHPVFFMEAMWTRFMPAYQKMRELIRAGEIGEVLHVTGDFNYATPHYDPKDRVFDPAMAGGALLDLGVYPLMACTDLLGWNPVQVQGLCAKTAEGVDMRTSLQMQYENGATAQIFCGMDVHSNSLLRVHGTKGFIEMPEFWHPTSLTLRAQGKTGREFTFPPEHEGHHYEFDYAAHCIREGMRESPVIPWAESRAIAEICTRVRHENGIYYPGE